MKHMFLFFFLMTSLSVMAQESIPQDTTIYLKDQSENVRSKDRK